MDLPSPGLPATLSPSDGVRGPLAGSKVQGAHKVRCVLSMNRPLTPSLSPSDGERVAEGRVRGGSWSQCVRKSESGLSMNLKVVCLQSNDLRKPGSWPQLTSEFWRCSLSMNRGGARLRRALTSIHWR